MKIKLLQATIAATVLMVGLLAGPAFAQPGFTPEGCASAVAAGNEQFLVDELDGAERPTLAELEAQGLTAEEVCTIYGAGVLDVVEERPSPPTVTPVDTPVQPTEVLGESLARTGVDSLMLALFGVGLVGLGIVAVRRSRRETADIDR